MMDATTAKIMTRESTTSKTGILIENLFERDHASNNEETFKNFSLMIDQQPFWISALERESQ